MRVRLQDGPSDRHFWYLHPCGVSTCRLNQSWTYPQYSKNDGVWLSKPVLKAASTVMLGLLTLGKASCCARRTFKQLYERPTWRKTGASGHQAAPVYWTKSLAPPPNPVLQKLWEIKMIINSLSYWVQGLFAMQQWITKTPLFWGLSGWSERETFSISYPPSLLTLLVPSTNCRGCISQRELGSCFCVDDRCQTFGLNVCVPQNSHGEALSWVWWHLEVGPLEGSRY